jgi:hypothetical protein
MAARQTLKQRAACARNWRIRNLRALYSLASILTGDRKEAAQLAIDQELALLGAETAAGRIDRLIRECNA